MIRWILVAAFSVVAAPSWADLSVSFNESAPKDRFTIRNTGGCAMPPTEIVIDLSPSRAGLIFDVTGSGAGVSVFQPFDVVAGREFLSALPDVRDGDKRLTLSLNGLDAGTTIAFTIDVDDTAGRSETMVSGSEMAGTRVTVRGAAGTSDATFGEATAVRLALSPCTS